ncbi:MAG: hypothetical protein JST30_14725 [Armatimonadetes bacterium]|nr:hypothetical protein [Armatimonadota bacterium]
MKPEHKPQRAQKAPVFVGLLLFSVVLVLLQLWLFVMAFENMLAHRVGAAVPAALGSLVILGVNAWMMVGVNRLDRDA